ncbi:acetate--CoA ligase [Microbacterium stercoris]|uniref:Acetate--CoA ligase n=1 Tax=Microbacterium stercoris TaxID=2820289 RepID=A0A939QPI4_9MICO|nr:acetate--CoA ligase [Microbacterium stercoris]MBO3662398.1 acetate--CoA ligase [Microbacterium stercoris]MBO3664390.1 acetate--CoA ligase [Microbacterium stercoris]
MTLIDHAEEARLVETRAYPAPADFAAQANVGEEAYARAAADPTAFWEEAARRLDWAAPWHTAHEWEPPVRDGDGELSVPAARWFVGGQLNVAYNCVDRHVEQGRGDKVALHFEGEPGDRTTVTYADLQRRVSQAANGLLALGIEAGDRVVVYLPVLIETVVIALACARIGAVHSLVFGGFSAEAVRFRIEDTGAKLLVTTDGQWRRGKAVEVKSAADQAADGIASIEHVLVVRRTGQDVPWTEGRDVWWHDVVETASPSHVPQPFDSEHPLFIIYTSGTTGKPKGLVHTSGGYLTQASWAHWAHFDAKDSDVHWCTADLAWVTAHTYELYGPLSNGLTQVIYEGTPDTPSRNRHLEIIERYGVTVYYTAPTLIRTFMTWWGDTIPQEHDLSTLRLLGTVGEAINPEAWVWFRRNHGRDELPIVDTWWQSETGAAMIAPLPGATTLKPGSATIPLPGIDAAVVDDDGEPVAPGRSGTLVVRRPWPGMARTVWGNPQRYRDSYWAPFAGKGEHGAYYVAGDGATVDDDGYIRILGRLDDVVNVSGHRLSTIEIESSLVAHPAVGEAGVAGVDDPLTGHAVVAFVTVRDEVSADELRAQVARDIGPIAKPRHLVFVPEIPKTRSGKILRRLLVQLWQGDTLGDTTSLQNPWAVDGIRDAVDALQKPDNTPKENA